MTIREGEWVRVGYTLIHESERDYSLPVDTAQTPYYVRATGMLASEANLGDDVTIVTQQGRRLKGTLLERQPGDWHTFGVMHPELRKATTYIQELQRTLRD